MATVFVCVLCAFGERTVNDTVTGAWRSGTTAVIPVSRGNLRFIGRQYVFDAKVADCLPLDFFVAGRLLLGGDRLVMTTTPCSTRWLWRRTRLPDFHEEARLDAVCDGHRAASTHVSPDVAEPGLRDGRPTLLGSRRGEISAGFHGIDRLHRIARAAVSRGRPGGRSGGLLTRGRRRRGYHSGGFDAGRQLRTLGATYGSGFALLFTCRAMLDNACPASRFP